MSLYRWVFKWRLKVRMFSHYAMIIPHLLIYCNKKLSYLQDRSPNDNISNSGKSASRNRNVICN